MRQPPLIDAWGAGGFRVSGLWRPGSLLILDDQPRSWPPLAASALEPADFTDILAAGPALCEFVLLGVGESAALPPRAVRDCIADARMGFEFMASASAARLHNVLVSEGRRFATALIAL